MLNKKYSNEDVQVSERYVIKITRNEAAGLVGQLYENDEKNSNQLVKFCGYIYTYYVEKPTSEEAVRHWAVDMYVSENYANNKNLGKDITYALLKHTACQEPILMRSSAFLHEIKMFSKTDSKMGYIMEFGKVYTE